MLYKQKFNTFIRIYDSGTPIINEKYEELPQYKHDIVCRWVMNWISGNNLLKDKDSFLSKFYQDRYPVYWKEAEILDKNNLL